MSSRPNIDAQPSSTADAADAERASLLVDERDGEGGKEVPRSPRPPSQPALPASTALPPPAAPPEAIPYWYKYAAFFALVVIQVTLALSFKAAQDSKGAYPFSPPAMLILSEFCKFLLSVGGLVSLAKPAALPGAPGSAPPADSLASKLTATWEQFKREAFSSSRGMLPLYASGLALLYCVNNNVTFVIFQWADGGNINLIKAGSTFVSAIILWQLLGRRVSAVQWGAILIQSSGLVITQFGANCKNANTPVLAPPVYLALLFSLTITAFSGVCNEKILKDVGAEGVSLHTVNTLMYAAGTVLNLLVHLFSGGAVGPSFFAGMGYPSSLTVLLCNSLIGIAVVAVYKYADAVVKTFASACSTAVLFIIGAVFFGVSLNVVVMAGCVCIFTATHLYSANPPAPLLAGAAAGAAAAAPPSSSGAASGAAAAPSSEGRPFPAAAAAGGAEGGSSLSRYLPQNARDTFLTGFCAFLLVVVFVEPFFLGGGAAKAGGARLLRAMCGEAGSPGFFTSDAVTSCFL